MKVELLYFDGCPSYTTLLPRLAAVLGAADESSATAVRHAKAEVT